MASAYKSLGIVARASSSAWRLSSGVRRAQALNRRTLACTPCRFANDDGNTSLSDDIARTVEESTANGNPMTEAQATEFVSWVRTMENSPKFLRDIQNKVSVKEFDGLPQGLVNDPVDLGIPEFKPKQGFFAEDEQDDEHDGDEDFEPDDISSNAHIELEQVRELREFARVMAWDMPLLYNHKKAFEAPTKAQPLRFRYTTYLGEDHPASQKVVLDFSPSALPDLTPVQRTKLIKLLGSRYNPQTDHVRMSSENHPTPAQNKRHLATTLDALLKECREGKDTFEDVPFDFRHHTDKVVHEFPEEWKITDERRQYLEASRAKRLEAVQTQALDGGQVDGARIIDGMLARGPAQGQAQQQREAVRVSAGRGGAPTKGARQRS